MEYHLVHTPEVELALEGARSDEIVGIQIAEVHRNQVYSHQGAHHKGGCTSAGKARELLGGKSLGGAFGSSAAPQQAEERENDKDGAAQGINPQKVAPVLTQGIYQGIGQGRVRSRGERARDGRNQGAQQTESAAEGEGNPAAAFEQGGRIIGAHQPVQRYEGEQREGELKHHQGHRHRPELIVEWNIVIKELGEGHKVASHPEQHSENGADDEPPLVLAAAAQQGEKEKEDRHRTHIHRPRGKRLGTPVEGQILAHSAQVLLPGSFKKVVSS